MEDKPKRGAKRLRRAIARQAQRTIDSNATASLSLLLETNRGKRKRPQGRKRACSHLAKKAEQKIAAKCRPFYSFDEFGKFRADSAPFVPSGSTIRYEPKKAK